ncbi:MAG TPA: hypothetical protein VL360_00005, partial [Gammaproteobacteria bacterium]|nr:hypothetical protein [Gammaproteobacteria bacterium]
MILTKELSIAKNDKLGLLRSILQSADSLDIMRCKKKFDIKKVSLFKEFTKLDNPSALINLAGNHLSIIAAQQDLQQDCAIMAGETPLLSSHATMDKKYLEKVCASVPEDSMSHADDLKAEYEHSVTCYQDIMSDFAGNSFIKQYLSPAPSLAVQVTYQQTEEQLQRSAIRESAPKITLNSDFAVKGLRNGGIFSEYLEGLLTGNHPHQLRTTSKKKYIVNGAGVHLRSEKQPQYTASEKQGYSKKQSVSIGTPAFHTPVFNFAGSYQHLVGMIFTDMKNLLLSNYLGLYDTGTTGRTNEFDNVEQARFFHSKIRSRLFSKANFNQLKSIIEDPETYSVSGPQYNESLVRLRFTADGTCKLIIARDTLESRLAAQAMSKILKKRLLELNLCDADFEVPVCYYMPDTPSLHLRMYTAAEKEMDKKAAQQFLENKIIRDIKFDVFDYNLLVALDETEFSSLIDDSHLINILTTTPHLYGFFKDLGFISGDYLENTYDDMMKRLLTKESIIALFFEIKNESLQPIMRMQYIQI